LKEPIIRKYGEEFYAALEKIAEEQNASKEVVSRES
jgi:hypothetical protein